MWTTSIVMFRKAFSNLRSHWFSNLGFPSGTVLLGESVMDVFDSSFYSDPLWISVRCCQGEEWKSRHTINRVSALPQRRQKYPAAYFSRRACKLFTSLQLTSLFVTNDITITCHSSQSKRAQNETSTDLGERSHICLAAAKISCVQVFWGYFKMLVRFWIRTGQG